MLTYKFVIAAIFGLLIVGSTLAFAFDISSVDWGASGAGGGISFNNLTGHGANTQIAYFNGSGQLESHINLSYNKTSNRAVIASMDFYRDANDNTIVGEDTGGTTLTSGTSNFLMGYQAGKGVTTADNNVLIGSGAGSAPNYVQAQNNVAIGKDAGKYLGNRNVAIGAYALDNSGDIQNAVAIGESALSACNGGNSNVAIGRSAMANSLGGHDNTAIGYLVAGLGTGADYNTFIGTQAGYWVQNDYNVEIGHHAGYQHRYGSENTIIGTQAGYGSAGVWTGTGNVYIGYQVGYSAGSVSNKLMIDNNATATPLIYGEFDTRVIRFGEDNTKVMLGQSNGVSTYFNGADWIFNAEVGSPDVLFTAFDNVTVQKDFTNNGTAWLNSTWATGGAIYTGPTTAETLGYENIRFGVYSNTPRIIFEDTTGDFGEIDFVGNTIRFILNDTASGGDVIPRAVLRINSTGARVGETGYRRNLDVYGDITTYDPAGGGGNAIIDGYANITGDLDNKGNYTGNMVYGGMWTHNHTAGIEMNFAIDGFYYHLYFVNQTHSNGVGAELGHLTESNLTIEIDGTYQITYMAIGDGQNNHVYFTTIFVNDDKKDNCGNHHKMSAGGDVITQSGTCFVNLYYGDKVSLRTADFGGTGTGNYYGGNVNILRVGDINGE